MNSIIRKLKKHGAAEMKLHRVFVVLQNHRNKGRAFGSA